MAINGSKKKNKAYLVIWLHKISTLGSPGSSIYKSDCLTFSITRPYFLLLATLPDLNHLD